MERRDRLRALMVRLEADGQVDRLLRAQEDDQAARVGEEEEEEEQIQYPFFTEGTQDLLNARVDIAQYSLPRAKARIERAKRRHEDPDEDPEAEADLVVKQAGEFVLECSEIGDDRPLTGCSFSRDASLLATSSPLAADLGAAPSSPLLSQRWPATTPRHVAVPRRCLLLTSPLPQIRNASRTAGLPLCRG
ncbi:U4/U6 small nuclear ribonucleoprotein PRP4-like protein [Panicum miliaceum]|uniref:U4/U6 small nuclear ribonucleoprotein PRP4-like protein n=1 Tax=Panicum miliaceum TaxID=4540 RepID=A0A3L6TH19_PANMI|nr:U4/U6 small nuclear ribonucleoprotein PRP4-like protein [Panicum miliaceum]